MNLFVQPTRISTDFVNRFAGICDQNSCSRQRSEPFPNFKVSASLNQPDFRTENTNHWSRRDFLLASSAAIATTLFPCNSTHAFSQTDLLFDSQNKSLVSSSKINSLLQRDLGSLFDRAIVVGEVHDDVDSHNVQLAVIDATRSLPDKRPIVVGLEQFYRSHDTYLTQYVNRIISLDDLLEKTDWDNTWGFDIELYRPIFQYCRRHSIPMCGLNVPATITSKIVKTGLSELPSSLKMSLPEGMDFNNVQHYNHFRDHVLGSHDLGPDLDTVLSRYYEVQVLWEEWMSQSATSILQSNPDSRLISLLGSSHVECRFGFPDRLEKRIHERPYTIVPVKMEKNNVETPVLPQEDLDLADLVWYTHDL